MAKESKQDNVGVDPLAMYDEHNVAVILGVAEGTLRNWRNKNVGPVFRKFVGSVRYRGSDLIAYIDQSAVATAQ